MRRMARRLKPIAFRGSSLKDLRAFPEDARHQAGYQLEKVQAGDEPADWKPMPSVGQGVNELRIWDGAGTFRVMYVAKFADAIYVLHCFQKKTRTTAAADIELGRTRYAALVKELKK